MSQSMDGLVLHPVSNSMLVSMCSSRVLARTFSTRLRLR
jgi:hypothetical protein